MQTDNAKRQALESNLMQFTGTATWWKIPLFARYSYWLIDAIFSHQYAKFIQSSESLQDFQVWELIVKKDQSASLQFSDGNETSKAVQQIEYTDFPLSNIKLYLCHRVLMLPGEY